MDANQPKRNIIKVTPDEDGRVTIKLYGKEIEIDKSMVKRGRAVIHKFGEEYEVVINRATAPDEAAEGVEDKQSVEALAPAEEDAEESEESDDVEEE